ncbi:hypothetical protein [Rubritepida flocculans]|uniref:hypothetical protein n=1 Tax=Rubritepida flocculans TaxID=182403 RepID=UPI0012ECB4E4|nr:hypothetical protein [Rubritepida flocculans]
MVAIFRSSSSLAMVTSPSLALSRSNSSLRLPRSRLHRRCRTGQRPAALSAQAGGGDVELAGQRLQRLAAQQPHDGGQLAWRGEAALPAPPEAPPAFSRLRAPSGSSLRI